MRHSNLNLPPIASVFQVASLVIIAACVAWVLIADMSRPEPQAARAEPPAQNGKSVQR
jgi:hypothetical protein